MPSLDARDEMAALEAVHLALSEIGDGASYVWHQRDGRLSGIISPTSSFKDPKGRVCRHIVMSLTAGRSTARTEGIACRLADRSWRLEG
jgi:surface antigen